MFLSSNNTTDESEDIPFDELKPLSRWSTSDFLSFLRYLEKSLNFTFSISTFSVLRQESWDGSALVEFQVSDLENLIPKHEAELIYSSIQKHVSHQKNMNEINDKLENVEMGSVLTSRLTTNVSNNVSSGSSVVTKPERKESTMVVPKKSSSSDNLEQKSSRFGTRTGIVITRRDSSLLRPNSNINTNSNNTNNNNNEPSSTNSNNTLSEGNSPISPSPQLSKGNQSPFSSTTNIPNNNTDSSPVTSTTPPPNNQQFRPPKPVGYTARKSTISSNNSSSPIQHSVNNNTSSNTTTITVTSATTMANNNNNNNYHHNNNSNNNSFDSDIIDTSSTNSSSSSSPLTDSSSSVRPSLDSTGSNSMVDSVLSNSSSSLSSSTNSNSGSKPKKKGARDRLVSCLVNSDLDNCVKPIDEKQLRQTVFPQILNNDLTLIEQLGKYKSRYKNIYLLLTDPSSFDTIIQRKVSGGTNNGSGKKKKLFDVKFESTSSDSSSSSAQSNGGGGGNGGGNSSNFEKMFPESEQTHATTSTITIDFASVQLSERLPLLIDFKQLTDLDRVLVSNVFKKLAPIDRRIFAHREKIFMAENLALPDCYNYAFFDNPTGEKSGTIILNDGADESSGGEPEKKSNLAKLFGRSSKKEEAYLQCQLVVFEFSESFMIEMKDTNRYKLLRTGLMIGNWFLEWKENSLVIPSRKPPQGLLRFNPHFHYIPLKKVEGEKNISALLSKLSEVCSLWNGTNVYNLKSCNHQHFVQDVIKALELVPLLKVEDKKQKGTYHHLLQYPFGTGVLKLLDRIEKYGFSDMAFYLNQPVKEALFGKKMAMELQQQGVERIVSGEAYSRLGENEKTLVGNIEYAPESIRNKYTYKTLQQKTSNTDEVPEDKNFIVFSSHAELDKVVFDLDSKIGSGSEGKDYFKTTNDGKWDLWLLKLYDRCFWIRLGTLKDGKKILNSKDAPLSNLPESSINVSNTGSFGPCLCPFNMSGVGINEFDMQLMMLNPTSSTAFLANHEPPIPDRIWLPYQ